MHTYSCIFALPFKYIYKHIYTYIHKSSFQISTYYSRLYLWMLGNRTHKASRSGEGIEPGECTLHARSCAGGVGIFYLLQQFTVLLIRDSRCCYYPQLSLYLDSSGEVSQSRSQNRPMFLSSKRYKQVENLYLSHSVAKEVVRTRSMEERYIRQFYYWSESRYIIYSIRVVIYWASFE